MKNLLFLFLLCLGFLGSTFAEPTVTIQGQITQTKYKAVSVYYFAEFIEYSRMMKSASLDQEGKFTIKMPLNQAQEVYLCYGRGTCIPLYLRPSQVVKVTADGSNFLKSVRYSGPHATDNQYLVSYYQQFMAYGKQYEVYSKIRKLQPAAFLQDIKASFANQRAFFVAAVKNHSLSADFTRYHEQMLQVQFWRNLCMYPINKALYTKQKVNLPEDYDKNLPKQINWQESLLSAGDYQAFVDYYSSYLFSKQQNNATPMKEYQFTRKLFASSKLTSFRFTQLAKVLYKALKGGQLSVKQLQGIYEHFMTNNTFPVFAKVVHKQYQLAKALDKGKAAPVFSLLDVNGQKVSLQDFKGKVVYIDFWASWCKPCMREVPHAKTLKNKLTAVKDEVVFLYISVDQNQTMWKKAIARKKISGVHLLAPGLSHSVAKAYNAQAIPQYIIIDRAGKIWNRNAARPSGNAYEQIQAALKSE